MKHIVENLTLLENRGNMYRLLGRIYQKEVDQELLNKLQALNFTVNCDEEMLNEGYRLFENFFNQKYLDVLSDLGADYAHIFLGTGAQEGDAAFPYESVYTSPSRLVMQESRDQVAEIYATYNMDISNDLLLPEDQLGLELEFMGHLISKTYDAFKAEDYAETEKLLDAQTSFLTLHLLNWISDFCTDILKCAETDFYKAIANITQGFLLLDKEILEYLSTSLTIIAYKEEKHKEYMATQISEEISQESSCLNRQL